MIKPLIETAQKVLAMAMPSDADLLHAQSELSSFLEALSTQRISAKVEIDDLEEAERLMRELQREISRRQAGMPSAPQTTSAKAMPTTPVTSPTAPVSEDTSPTAVPAETVDQTEPPIAQTLAQDETGAPPPIFSQILQSEGLGGMDGDPLKRFFQSAHDPEAERLMDQAEEAFYKAITK